jgi:carbon-monoxide dehydrogenase large subunit
VDFLGVPLEKVDIIAGDTAVVKVGGGAHSGRGMRLGSIVIWNASNKVIEKGKRIAARLLDCEPSGVRFERAVTDKGDRRQSDPALLGKFVREGTDRAVGLFEVAAAAQKLSDLPEDLRGPLLEISDETIGVASFPTARTCAKSKSIRKPASWRSCATRPWTTWAAQ